MIPILINIRVVLKLKYFIVNNTNNNNITVCIIC